ncbi:Phosphopantothenoylcysteine decarboxylase [Spatholobus suberectus]|nr:Phosphopantothenoylcysteine decarboxylase [Spatholobus suberectus]
MSSYMWRNPSTKRNYITVDELGTFFIRPVGQRTASGEYEHGIMAEPFTVYSTVRVYYEDVIF